MIQIIDLFCGGGGFTKGCFEAGYEPVLCIDNWDNALKFHELNFPGIPFLKLELGGCIEQVAKTIELFIDRNFHIHLHGSPPCQELSIASNHNSFEGYKMVKWFLKLVKRIKPNSWSMENVLPVSHYLDKDSIPYVKLNSADFGVPQTRKRVFAGEGWYAKKTHSKDNWVSIIQALPDLECELNEIVNSKIRKRTINEPIRTITSKIHSQVGFVSNVFLNNAANNASSSRRALSVDTSINLPNKTITNQNPILRKKENNKFKKIRYLTLEETLILQSWNNAKIPDMNKKDLFKIIGNMVCPLVAKAIIEGIQINNKINFERTFNAMKFEQIKLF